jgi:rifampicin phosphotransferase
MGYPGDFALTQPDKPAMIMAESGHGITYADLDRRSRALAVLMRRSGLRSGDTVAVVSENRLEWAEIVWAAARAGLDLAPLNFHLGSGELAAMLSACDARAVFCSPDCRLGVEEAAAAQANELVLWCLDGSLDGGYGSLLASVDEPLVCEILGGRVMFSSGTTGSPKAIRHRSMTVHPRDAAPHLGEYTGLFDMDNDSVYLSPAPIYHTAPFRFVFAMTQLGATVVCMERFDAANALDAMQRYGVTHAQFVPTMLLRMDALGEQEKAQADLSALRVAITGAAPCPPELKDRMLSWWGPVLHELYGASEGYGNTHIGPEEAAQHRGSVGRAVRGRIRITDGDGSLLPVGHDGVIWFEDGTQNSADGDAWRTVGDLGHLAEDGYLYLVGRANQIIVCGGVNIHPLEVEGVLALHPAVLDVAVVGRPHPEYGEIVVAYVVPRVGDADGSALATDVINYCRDRLAHYKCPREVYSVTELPRGDNGKMYSRLLARMDQTGVKDATKRIADGAMISVDAPAGTVSVRLTNQGGIGMDITKPWVVDNELSTRWPVYTRANVGEVSGTVATPLFWSMIGGPPNEGQWKAALVEFGAFDLDEFRPGELDIQALIHGYVYLNLSQSRTFGARMPGATPDLMDRTYLGDVKAPTYVPHPDDDRPEFTERILATIGRVMSETSRPDLEEHRQLAEKLRAERPDFSAMSPRALVDRQRTVLREYFGPIVLRTHLRMVYEGSVVAGALDQALAPLGDPSLAVTLTSGLGNIASAAPNIAMWHLGRLVKESPALSAEFGAGISGLNERLRSSQDPAVRDFVAGFDDLLYQFGSRSTQEWEANAKTWESFPAIPLGMIDRMRLQPEEKSPEGQQLRLRAERENAMTRIKEHLADRPAELAALEAVLQSVSLYSAAREQSKSNTIRVLHEGRLPMVELGRRYAAAGYFSRPDDIMMLREDELDELLADPAAFRDVIAERWAWFGELSEFEPPFIIEAGKVPPITSWTRRKTPAIDVAVAGEVLTGLPACAGVATGIARVIHDPEDAADLEPGEVLVAPLTDPGWTPIFTSAEAVVVNVGSPMSHAAIVSRELGIPCVLGVRDATKRIPDGARITVDGGAGTVTVH